MRSRRASSFVAATAAAVAATFALAPRDARAESGTLNLHIDLGASAPVYGEFAPLNGGNLPLGPTGMLALDWQLAPPVALEVIAGGGYILGPLPNGSMSGVPYVGTGLGARVRFLDNQEGYGNEPGGDYMGNSWVSAHVGYHLFDGSQLGIDVGGGYEWSVYRPIQVGVFVRGALLLDFQAGRSLDILATAGLNVSFELGRRAPAVDTDRDGLSDEREVQRWHTDPNNPDTDGDGLNDGLEARTNTNPVSPDTDGDTLRDGAEDANHDGDVDDRESDPRVADTDHGGVNDGWEAAHPPHNLRDPADDDSDRDTVRDDRDECPNTPRGAEIDARGCVILRQELVLEGITFEYNSAVILPASEETLQRALQTLRDNPNVTVEVGGYTDNVGSAGFNQTLSLNRAQAVHDWLVGHGIPDERLRVRGYGATRPRASNDTEEGRAQNRRIEFHRLDSPQGNRR